MSVILVATIGDRDVRLTDRSKLPEAMRAVWTPARIEGEEILAHPDRYREALSFPIIAPVIRWLLEDQGVAKDELYVHLFATDQPEADTPEAEWKKDTIAYAKVIKQHLVEGMPGLRRPPQQRLAKKRVHVHTITANPARYRTMLDFLTGELARLAQYTKPEDRVYLEVTGGTPAMTSMMIVAGADVFGGQAQCLYKEREETEPAVIGILDRFIERRVRATLREQLNLYAYTSALATFGDNPALISKDIEQQAMIRGLLTYIERRLAFDFTRARQSLKEIDPLAPPEIQPRISRLRRELAEPDQAALMAELVHNACIKFEMGHYADFTQRLFRFQEEGFRYLAREMGMKYANNDKNERKVSMAWIRGVSGMEGHLRQYTPHYGDRSPIPIDVEKRNLNRVSLGAIVDFFVDVGPDWREKTQAVNGLHRLSAVAQLRNKGIAGHDFKGIGKPDLEEAFGEPAENIVPLLKQVYEQIFGKPAGESPYDAVNTLIQGLLGN